MARIRSIKPEFFTSLTIAKLPVAARLTFVGLWTYVDDEGRGRDEPRLLKAALWPLDDSRTADQLDADLAQLAGVGLIDRYHVDGERYIQVRNWREHQYIQKPKPSKIPPCPERRTHTEPLPEGDGTQTVLLPTGREGKGKDSVSAEADPRTTKRKPRTTTDAAPNWVGRCVAVFLAETGGTVSPGELGRHLKPLVAHHGEAEVERVWLAACRWAKRAGKVPRLRPSFFAQDFGEHQARAGDPDTCEMTDDYGVMRVHRRDPATGAWIPGEVVDEVAA